MWPPAMSISLCWRGLKVGQPPRPLTPHASLWHYLGGELRSWRGDACLSLDRLGERVHFSGDTIAKVEKAERRPNSLLIEACDRELGAAGALVRLLKLAEATDRAQRRQRELVEVGTGAAALPLVAASGDEADALSRPPGGAGRPAAVVRAG